MAIEKRKLKEQRELAIEEIRRMLREQDGEFQFDKYEGCPSVEVQGCNGETWPFRVIKVYIDEDDDIMLSGDDFTEEVWETEGIWNVIDDGIQKIADALRRATRKDYISLIDNLRKDMKRELWHIIEAHKDDERCDCPRGFDEVSFEHKHFCEVDLNGSTYEVDAVKIEQWFRGSLRLSIAAFEQWYDVDNVEEIAGILHAVRNTLDIPMSNEKDNDE